MVYNFQRFAESIETIFVNETLITDKFKILSFNNTQQSSFLKQCLSIGVLLKVSSVPPNQNFKGATKILSVAFRLSLKFCSKKSVCFDSDRFSVSQIFLDVLVCHTDLFLKALIHAFS
jgi:hypothetical protein